MFFLVFDFLSFIFIIDGDNLFFENFGGWIESDDLFCNFLIFVGFVVLDNVINFCFRVDFSGMRLEVLVFKNMLFLRLINLNCIVFMVDIFIFVFGLIIVVIFFNGKLIFFVINVFFIRFFFFFFLVIFV